MLFHRVSDEAFATLLPLSTNILTLLVCSFFQINPCTVTKWSIFSLRIYLKADLGNTCSAVLKEISAVIDILKISDSCCSVVPGPPPPCNPSVLSVTTHNVNLAGKSPGKSWNFISVPFRPSLLVTQNNMSKY